MKPTKQLKRVSKKRYRQLKAELGRTIHELGFTYRVRRLPPCWASDMPYQVTGFFRWSKRFISVTVYGNCSHADILFMLAHETRHLIHAVSGLYSDYYDYRNFNNIKLFKRGKDVEWRWPNLGVATRAERDCDRWAYTWLKERDVYVSKDHLYPHWMTMAYGVTKDLQRHIKAKKHESSIHRQQPFLHQPDQRPVQPLQVGEQDAQRVDTGSWSN